MLHRGKFFGLFFWDSHKIIKRRGEGRGNYRHFPPSVRGKKFGKFLGGNCSYLREKTLEREGEITFIFLPSLGGGDSPLFGVKKSTGDNLSKMPQAGRAPIDKHALK